MIKIIFALGASISLISAYAQQDMKTFFKDEGKSSLELIQETQDGNKLQGILTNETAYRAFWAEIIKGSENYIAKLQYRTLSYLNTDGQQREIKGEIFAYNNPTKTITSFTHEADEIKLNTNYYSTLLYGCCGAPTEIAIYDYKNNEIINGLNTIYQTALYASKDMDYIFISARDYKSDGTASNDTIGILTYAYGAGDKYDFYIINKNAHACYSYEYLVHINSEPQKVDAYNQEYITHFTIPEIEKIDSKEKLNMQIRIDLNCISAGAGSDGEWNKKYYVQIPIVNGKPFNTMAKTRSVMVQEE